MNGTKKLTLINRNRMGELKDTEAYEEELIDYEEEEEKAPDSAKPVAESGKKLVSLLFILSIYFTMKMKTFVSY